MNKVLSFMIIAILLSTTVMAMSERRNVTEEEKVLCKETLGIWAAGICSCTRDGIWDSEKGCVNPNTGKKITGYIVHPAVQIGAVIALLIIVYYIVKVYGKNESKNV